MATNECGRGGNASSEAPPVRPAIQKAARKAVQPEIGRAA